MRKTAAQAARAAPRPLGMDSGQFGEDDDRLRVDADRLLLTIARPDGWRLAVLGCASVTGSVAQVLLPAAIGRAVDSVLAAAADHTGTRAAAMQQAMRHAASATGGWLAGCVLVVAVIACTGAVASLVTGTASATATARLRLRLAGHVLRCGPRLLRSFSPGDAVSRIVGGTAEAGAAPTSVVLAVTAVIPPAGAVIALGLIDPWLVAAFVAGFPALAFILRTLVRDSAVVSAEYQRAQGSIAARLLDALAGARTIAAAGSRDQEQDRVLAPLAALRDQGDAFWRVQARAAAQAMTIAPALQVIVVAVAGIELARRQVTPGELVAASQYAVLAVGIGVGTGLVSQLGRARGGARRAAVLLAQPRQRYGAGSLAPGPGELRLRGVTVRADGEAVLRDLELTVPGGMAVAVVGMSGAGKSTLAGLAGRLADPDEGSVTLDGADLRTLARRAVREAVVYAFERPELTGATPLEAISFGISRPSREQVLTAAEDSRAATFLTRLPDGLDTPLAQVPMSGGEVQRLGLARAFAHAGAARLVILDDATSSLDTVTEMLVSQALADQLSDRTRLIVAHRVTTAARADLVAWLDGGRVRALAPHRELWADARWRAA
jgi:ATP-binding cassette subfamily B protein